MLPIGRCQAKTDRAKGPDEEKRRAFSRTYATLNSHIRAFLKLPIESMDKVNLRRRLMEIAQTIPESFQPEVPPQRK